MERCKHSLEVGTCWLCLGRRQTGDEPGRGTPPWFINTVQLALQTSFVRHLKRGYTSDEVEEMMPRGSKNPNSKTELPYMKRTTDPKTRSQYDRLKSRKGYETEEKDKEES